MRANLSADWLADASIDELRDRIVDPPPTDNNGHQFKCRQRLALKGIYSPKPQTAEIDALMRLHRLAGHASSRVIAQYAKAYLTKEQRRQLSPIGRLFCSSCARTKSKRAARSKVPTAKPNPTAWAKMGVDVLGRFKHTSIVGGYRYAMIFVDQVCNMTRVYPMNTLSEVPSTLDAHFNWVRINFPKAYQNLELDRDHILRLRSDSANYFLSKASQVIYAKHNILHTASPPRTQRNNGAVERCIYSLTDSANACRAAQRLSNRYWWLALSHASDVHNHIPTATNDGVPPITAATGAPPNLHQFRIFGCDAYVVRDKRQEGEHRAEKGIYVGYDSTSGTHKVIFPPSRDMTVGDTRLMQARTTQIGALPKKYQQSQRKTIHVRFNDTVLPPAVINGEVHPTSPTYRPFHRDDEDPEIEDSSNVAEEGGAPPNSATTEPTSDDSPDSGDLTDQPDHNRDTWQMPGDTLDIDWYRAHALSERAFGSPSAMPIATVQSIFAHDLTPDPGGVHKAARKEGQVYRTFSSIEQVDPIETDPLLGAIPQCCAISDTFSTLTKARASQYPHLVEGAKDAEMQQMREKNILTPIHISKVPKGERIFTSVMNFRLKRDSENKPTIMKARLCFGGQHMEEGVHYTDKSAFTPRYSTVRAHFARAAQNRQRIKALDINGAFLRGQPQKPLYMRSPFDWKSKQVWVCTGNLYGRVDSAHIWQQTLTTHLESIGFRSSTADPCLFTRTTAKGGFTQIVTWVDDISYWSTDTKDLALFEQQITTEYGDAGPHYPSQFLGLNVQQTNGNIHISCKALIERAGKRFFPKRNPHLHSPEMEDPDSMDLSHVNTDKAKTPFPSKGSALGCHSGGVDLDDMPKYGEPRLDKPFRELLGPASTTRCPLMLLLHFGAVQPQHLLSLKLREARDETSFLSQSQRQLVLDQVQLKKHRLHWKNIKSQNHSLSTDRGLVTSILHNRSWLKQQQQQQQRALLLAEEAADDLCY
jgi:hypothetical protein